ncbi:MAG: helix-turn-helix domain-containing protein [Candidatus Glassbacteria bacterium]
MKSLRLNKILFLHAITGAVLGFFVLHPSTMIIYQFEFEPPSGSLIEIIGTTFEHLFSSFEWSMLQMGLYFVLLGGFLGLGSGIYYRSLTKKKLLLQKFEMELHRNILSIMEEGENEKVEFKSTLRWDLKTAEVNKDLEKSILKSIAGFMNGQGGTLIIGVGDEGEITGLEMDYSTLKKKNRDGFEQHIMQLISCFMGTDLCACVHMMFHKIGKKEICRIYIEASPRPVYLQSGNSARYYIRTGNSTRELNVEEAIRHVSTWHKNVS